MQPMLLLKHQQIKFSFPSLLSRPKADEAWIRQVLINLVHNASKHTDEAGTILITVTQDDQQVVVTVTDTGHGLLGNERETLFREFYQENQNKKEYQDGFGLGLSIVRAIIERHHGKVYITSTKEMGTMVSFNLPAEASR
jgi:K+-sensing histidine kinase KdpD